MRSRIIRPDLVNDPGLWRLPHGAILLYQLSWMAMDRNGVMPADAGFLKATLFRHDAKTRCSNITRWIDKLVHAHRYVVFEHDRVKYLIDPEFELHQKIHRNESVVYNVPAAVISRVLREFIENKLVQSLDPSTSTSTSISSSDSDKKNQAFEGGSDATHKQGASLSEDAELRAGQEKLQKRRRDLGIEQRPAASHNQAMAAAELEPAEFQVKNFIFHTWEQVREFQIKNKDQGPWTVTRLKNGFWEIFSATSDNKQIGQFKNSTKSE